jgi:hypothetical protein
VRRRDVTFYVPGRHGREPVRVDLVGDLTLQDVYRAEFPDGFRLTVDLTIKPRKGERDSFDLGIVTTMWKDGDVVSRKTL